MLLDIERIIQIKEYVPSYKAQRQIKWIVTCLVVAPRLLEIFLVPDALDFSEVSYKISKVIYISCIFDYLSY